MISGVRYFDKVVDFFSCDSFSMIAIGFLFDVKVNVDMYVVIGSGY
jgi:hypothetical protein